MSEGGDKTTVEQQPFGATAEPADPAAEPAADPAADPAAAPVEPPAGEAAATRIVSAEQSGTASEPATNLKVHDQPSTADMAEKTRRQRRRERDSRTEKSAQRLLIAGFIGVAALALIVVNSGFLPEDPTPEPTEAGKDVAATAPKRAPSAPKLAAAPAQRADIPALASLEREGLTIVAEGLPEVLAIEPATPPEQVVAIESCRYAYAIWEFSPNKRFKFYSTCELMEGQVLAGAWTRDGAKIRMSPITSGASELLSVFAVESPSEMVTEVQITSGGQTLQLRVKQRITGMRGGMDGEGFHANFRSRNKTKVHGIRIVRTPPPGTKAPATPPPAPHKSDPLLDLLQQN